MQMTTAAIDPAKLREALFDPQAGACASFEGWIRNHNDGRAVKRLEYEAHEPVAIREGARVIAEAREKFEVLEIHCVHRTGMLEIGDCAVWVGVCAAHRDAAFAACRYVIDQVKVRLPIWKKEHYVDGTSGWVSCERCASHAEPQPRHASHTRRG